jgi:hypothetical protein
VTGAVLTKMDGDSRGGAALSVHEVSGKPIKFVGTGERLEALEPFYPDRLAGRILGMGATPRAGRSPAWQPASEPGPSCGTSWRLLRSARTKIAGAHA